jgi:hypothetical protein
MKFSNKLKLCTPKSRLNAKLEKPIQGTLKDNSAKYEQTEIRHKSHNIFSKDGFAR